jgi:uncharacterized protein with PQ loop repeat
MTIYRILGLVSAVIFLFGYLPYVISIVKGKSKPHPVTWMLFAILGGVALFFTVQAGARDTLPLVVLNFLLPLMIAVLSLKYWEGGFSRFDYTCLGFSLLAILAYILFRNASFSITISILGDMLAYLPTLKKTYKDPSSEHPLTWALFALGCGLSVVAAIPNFAYGIVVYPAYLAISDIVMVVLILRGRLKKAQ